MATLFEYYVNLASTSGGDGSTNLTTGATRAFDSLSSAATYIKDVSSHTNDLVGADATVTIYMNGAGLDSASVNFSNLTTDATRNLTIVGMDNATGFNTSGIWDEVNYYTLTEAEPLKLPAYGSISKFQIKQTPVSSTKKLIQGATGCVAEKMLCKLTENAYATDGLQDIDCYNCVVWCTDTAAPITNCRGLKPTLSTNKIINCTVYGRFDIGMDQMVTGAKILNTVVCNTSDDFNPTTSPTINYCASDDGDGTNSVDISPTTESTDWDAAFTDRTNDDFTIKDASSPLHASGLGSSTDADVPLDDYLGNTRNTTTPSIGAFELVGTSFKPQVLFFF
jgi:hypothetical protein